MESSDALSGVRRDPWPGSAALVALVLAAYAPVFWAGFVWDDGVQLVHNALIHAPDGLVAYWFSARAPDYFPLTSTTLWLEWRLWGEAPLGYHVTNLALHTLASVALWRVLRRLEMPGAWFAAALFAVHPVGVSSVAWIAERKNVLSLALLALSALAYLRSEATDRRRDHGIAVGAFAASLLAKTSGVMLPVALLALAWYRRGRVTVADLRRTAPLFALALALGLVTVYFQHANAIGGEVVRPEGLASRIAAAAWAAWFYLYKALVPLGLAAIYPRWHVDPTRLASWLPLVALVGCAGLAWHLRARGGRGLLAGVGVFWILLLPVLGLIDMAFMRYSLVADHLQYPALVAPLALVVAAAHRASLRVAWGPGAARALAVLALCLCTGLSAQRASVYRSEVSLWADTVRKSPGAWAAYQNLAVAHAERGEFDEALRGFRAALAVDPGLASAHVGIANVFHRQGLEAAAIEEYRRALALVPDSATAHFDLAIALEASGRQREAIGHYRLALASAPEHPEAHNNLAVALSGQGDLKGAIAHLQQAVAARPEYTDARYNLAKLLVAAGRLEQAEASYRRLLQSSPHHAAAHVDLGALLAARGRLDAAIGHYREALRLDPDDPRAQRALGLALQTQKAGD